MTARERGTGAACEGKGELREREHQRVCAGEKEVALGTAPALEDGDEAGRSVGERRLGRERGRQGDAEARGRASDEELGSRVRPGAVGLVGWARSRFGPPAGLTWTWPGGEASLPFFYERFSLFYFLFCFKTTLK
jgi:hypothetical protein